MSLGPEAQTLHDLTADAPDWVSIDLLKNALPEQEWKAFFFLYGNRAMVRVKPNPIYPAIRYVEGFYR